MSCDSSRQRYRAATERRIVLRLKGRHRRKAGENSRSPAHGADNASIMPPASLFAYLMARNEGDDMPTECHQNGIDAVLHVAGGLARKARRSPRTLFGHYRRSYRVDARQRLATSRCSRGPHIILTSVGKNTRLRRLVADKCMISQCRDSPSYFISVRHAMSHHLSMGDV